MKKYVCLLICLFVFPLTVFAENGYVTDSGGCNLREKPSTSSSVKVITKIPKNTSFYISDTNAATGGGCSKAWYYVYYNGEYGYVCSNLVAIEGDLKTSYNRPWTSPKKAIVGGAEVIGKTYISKGQNTSYLKKFNVNPKGYYSVFNHQYMSNLRAPAGEAVTTYNSLKENNMLDKPYDFSIPVYTDMPSQSYAYSGLYSGYDMLTSTETDDAFEEMIKDFDETYKPYLRYLHSKHDNWIFTPMITGLSFDEVYLSEKNVCSIEISSKYCEQSPYKVTESGWCVANEAATKYFIDPRNFLTEKYIFMFQNLGYSDAITEDAVQSVLDGTFMEGMSILDNQSYASIFVEAGKAEKTNVSPLYLAALSIQEVGSKGSMATTGDEFTYQGYTYHGLYNFFNIGAYSSEESPVRAGLVYANGGRGQNNSIPTTETSVTNNFLEILKLTKEDDYVKGYDIGTTVDYILKNVGDQASVVVKDSTGKELGNDEKIGTGYIIDITSGDDNNSYTYVMYGDITGDGDVNSADLLAIRLHLLGDNTLGGAYKVSANVTKDDDINSADLLLVRQYLLGQTEIEQ